MYMRTAFLKYAFIPLLFVSIQSTAQNLIASDLPEWIAGQTGGTASFGEFGGSNEQLEVNGPFGTPVTVWSAASTATTSGSGQSGGWIHQGIPLSTTKTYRIAYWMRSTGSTTCNNNAAFFTVPLGGGANAEPLRIETGMSPRYWPSVYNGVLPNDTWVLVVGYLYSENASTFDLTSGVFDPATYTGSGSLPAPIASAYNHKFPSGYTELNVHLRNDLWDCLAGEVQYSYLPRIEEVNGTEPSIQQLLTPPSGGGSSIWSTSGPIASYTGEVAVGATAIPTGYKMAIDGQLIVEEVRVELSDSWPDYVFSRDYDLPTIQEIQEYIRKNRHLPNIPPASEVEANGIALGEMSKLILEKIEESTRYILQHEKRITALEKSDKNENR